MVGSSGRPDETPTTGHEWDGITEFNNPLPRWWLWTFYATVLWAVAYWIAMPAWPLVEGYTRGLLGYSQRAVVAGQVADRDAMQARYVERIAAASLEEIAADPELLSFALAGGRSAYAVNCSQCHGSGAEGAVGYPNLNDDDWLWGGSLEAIAYTIRHGVRNESDESRYSEMPAYGRDGFLEPEQIVAVVRYVLSLSAGGDGPVAGEGADIFAEQCSICHGEDGRGSVDLGAPNLTDAIWLFGGDYESVLAQVQNSRGGVMPAWGERLPPETIKQLAIYVHALGGGT